MHTLFDQLDTSWKKQLGSVFLHQNMQPLYDFLEAERQQGKVIYPQKEHYFSAFNLTPMQDVKVVILGQDPYHGEGQAHGLSFSVPAEQRIPPSLRNIYKALQLDLNIPPANHGCLIPWAQQGVLLLNHVLTVEQGKAGSHQGKGWECFTEHIMQVLNAQTKHLVFMLWGSAAQQQGQCIDANKHLVLQAPHPSPLSAYRGFFEQQHFSKSNLYLQKHGKTPIQWVLPPLKHQTKTSAAQQSITFLQ